MSDYDSDLSEYDNMVNKSADIRELIWDNHPNAAEMIGCPYSVLCYAEEEIKKLQAKVEKLTRERT